MQMDFAGTILAQFYGASSWVSLQNQLDEEKRGMKTLVFPPNYSYTVIVCLCMCVWASFFIVVDGRTDAKANSNGTNLYHSLSPALSRGLCRHYVAKCQIYDFC